MTERRLMSRGPIGDSYWLEPGRFLAGEYPGARDEREARDRLRRLLDAGVTLFIDLTEAEEYDLKPYAALLGEEASRLGRTVEHRRMSIPDMGVPTAEEMGRILAAIDGALEAGDVAYVHCYGGIGRTGTVVGCYLVAHGMSGKEAMKEIARLRRGMGDGWRRSPETRAQRAMVRRWGRG